MAEQKRTLQNFFEKARMSSPVTSADEMRTLLENTGRAGTNAARPKRFINRRTMNILGTGMIGTIMIGATALYLSHKQPQGTPETHVVGDRSSVIDTAAPGQKVAVMHAAHIGGVVPTTSSTASPIHYQGMLTGNDGVPLQGAHRLILNLYAADTGGASIWRETHAVTLNNDGAFNVQLGEKTPLTMSAEGPYWMGVSVDGNTEMRPRTKVGKIPGATIKHEVKMHGAIGNNGNSARQAVNPDASAVDQETMNLFQPYIDASDLECLKFVASAANNARKHDSPTWTTGASRREIHERKIIVKNSDEGGDSKRVSIDLDTTLPNTTMPNDSLEHKVVVIRRIERSDSAANAAELEENPHGASGQVVNQMNTTRVYDRPDYSTFAPIDTTAIVLSDGGIRMVELSPAELVPLGLLRDSSGVWLHLKQSEIPGTELSPKLEHIGRYDVHFLGLPAGCTLSRVPGMAVAPIAYTDDMGHWRTLRYDANAVDPELAAKEETYPIGSKERMQIAEEITHKAELQTIRRIGTFVPIIVHGGWKFTQEDLKLRHWRPDIIFWYEPTDELLAALPERVRANLKRELATSECMVKKIETGAVSQDCQGAIDRLQPQQQIGTKQTFDRRTGVVTFEPVYLDLFRSATGAIASAIVYPNPAVDKITIRYKLDAERHVTISLHDIQGRRLRELGHGQDSPAGESTVNALLENITPGIYLLAVSTDKGEQAVQRVIVVDRR